MPHEESKLERLKKLDLRVQMAGTIESLCFGIVGALVFGIGMCFFLDVFEGVPTFEISKEALSGGIRAVDLLTDHAAVFPSKGEMRKMAQGGGVAINKEKLAAFDAIIDEKAFHDLTELSVTEGGDKEHLMVSIKLDEVVGCKILR